MRNTRAISSASLLGLLLMSGCSLFVPDGKREHLKAKNYDIKVDERLWKNTNPDISDYAYLNRTTGNHFIINSICKKYRGSSPDALMNSILKGIKSVRIDENKTFKLAERDALKLKGEGMVDGVSFQFFLITTNRNRCVYDFALISANKKIPSNEEDSVLNALQTLRFK